MTAHDVVLIEGDGIGPEITAAAMEVIDVAGVTIRWEEHSAGYEAWQATGRSAPERTIERVRAVGAALKGPFLTPALASERSANWYLRRELDLYACVRPVVDLDGEIDVLLVRENVEDLYGSIEWMADEETAHALKVATRRGCNRIARFALDLAVSAGRRKVTVVHKANNLVLTEGMFLEAAAEVAREYPSLVVDDLMADTAASEMVKAPGDLDVVLTSNTFGDILSNVLGAVAGSIGLVPSGNYGYGCFIAEPSHGSAPELAGTGQANPIAMITAAALLLDYLGHPAEARAVDEATRVARRNGANTPDLGGTATTAEVTAEVASLVRSACSDSPAARR